jgi:hypothetical protein
MLKRGLRELRTLTYATITEKMCVTIDKGKKPGHFGKLKNPPGHNYKAWKKDMSGKTRAHGNPTLTFTNGKKTQRKKQHKHGRKLGGANAPPIFFYLTIVFLVVSCRATNKKKKIKYFQNHYLGDVETEYKTHIFLLFLHSLVN